MNNTNRVYENGTVDKSKVALAGALASQDLIRQNRLQNVANQNTQTQAADKGAPIGVVTGTVGAINGILKNKADNPGGSGGGNKNPSSSGSRVTVSSGGRFSTGIADTAPVTPTEPKKTVADYYQEAMNATNERLKQA